MAGKGGFGGLVCFQPRPQVSHLVAGDIGDQAIQGWMLLFAGRQLSDLGKDVHVHARLRWHRGTYRTHGKAVYIRDIARQQIHAYFNPVICQRVGRISAARSSP
jgi:hypothetical protein